MSEESTPLNNISNNKKIIRLQANVRGFMERLKSKKKNEIDTKSMNHQYTYPHYFPRGPPPRGPPGMHTYHNVNTILSDDEINKETEPEPDESSNKDENSNKDKNTKKKNLSMSNIVNLAKLVQKEVVNEDEFRDIVKRIRKRNEEVEWSLKQELILKSVGEKSCCYYLLHRDIADDYRKMYQKSMMWIFTQTMISSVIMFVASGIHTNCAENTLFIIPLVAGALNLLIAFQQKILEFKQPERYMLEHATTSKSFRELYDDINIQLGLSRKERSPMPLYLNMMKDKYIMCKKIAPYVSKSKYGIFETTYLNRIDPASINGRNIGNFMNAFQLMSNDSVTSGDWDLLTRKKLNGIPEDILGLTPIDISKRDILLSDEKRRLDNNEELVDYKLRSKHKIHQLKKKYKEDEEDYNSDLSFDLNSSNNSSDISDDEQVNDQQPVLLLTGNKNSRKIGEENV